MAERTPAGGDRSEVIFYDADGTVLPTAEGAVGAEVREYAGDVMIKRTYMSRDAATPQWTPPGQVVAEPDFADFAKNTWDVYHLAADGTMRLVNTVEDLIAELEVPADDVEAQKDAILRLMTLPAWYAAPPELKQDVAHWLATH